MVCCVELEIDDPQLQKPDEVRCPNILATGGCGIYANRPHTCAVWYCGWRLLNVSDALRPDIANVLMIPEMCDEPGYEKGGLRLTALGGRAEALLQPEVIDLAGRCVANGVPIFLSYGAGNHCKRVFVNELAKAAVHAGHRAAFVQLVVGLIDQMVAQVRRETEGLAARRR